MFEFLKRIMPQSMETVSTRDLEGLLSTGKITLLDVRTAQEYRGGHIRQARNLPLDRIGTYQGPKGEVVYVICQSGMRSKRAAHLLKEKGYRVANVRGGMAAYQGKTIGGK